eukprot:TRINITY_DN1528_c0_g1_i2.p1 TRINITY_DN1528_c0_g1~~TRINITY_DN1528_c0_g1_i2.p1  ORF type:complete len:454 (+),score=79.27 TRINITY_DN1528_c0_g1_i2:989-2350(+)
MKNKFRLSVPNNSITLYTATEKEKRDWLVKLNKTIENHIKEQNDLKGLSSETRVKSPTLQRTQTMVPSTANNSNKPPVWVTSSISLSPRQTGDIRATTTYQPNSESTPNLSTAMAAASSFDGPGQSLGPAHSISSFSATSFGQGPLPVHGPAKPRPTQPHPQLQSNGQVNPNSLRPHRARSPANSYPSTESETPPTSKASVSCNPAKNLRPLRDLPGSSTAAQSPSPSTTNFNSSSGLDAKKPVRSMPNTANVSRFPTLPAKKFGMDPFSSSSAPSSPPPSSPPTQGLSHSSEGALFTIPSSPVLQTKQQSQTNSLPLSPSSSLESVATTPGSGFTPAVSPSRNVAKSPVRRMPNPAAATLGRRQVGSAPGPDTSSTPHTFGAATSSVSTTSGTGSLTSATTFAGHSSVGAEGIHRQTVTAAGPTATAKVSWQNPRLPALFKNMPPRDTSLQS